MSFCGAGLQEATLGDENPVSWFLVGPPWGTPNPHWDQRL